MAKSDIDFTPEFHSYFLNLTSQAEKKNAEASTVVENMVKLYRKTVWGNFVKTIKREDYNLAGQLEKEIKCFARSCMTMWFDLGGPLYCLNTLIIKKYQQLHKAAKRDRIFQMILGSRLKDNQLGALTAEDTFTLHKDVSRQKRHGNYVQTMMSFTPKNVEEDKYYELGEAIPIIFEELVERKTALVVAKDPNLHSDCFPERESTTETDLLDPRYFEDPIELRVVVLCHGFQGSHVDMIKFKHYLKLSVPDAFIISSKSNQGKTTEHIGLQGRNLANEIDELLDKPLKEGSLKSISFVGHSLGSLCFSRRPHNSNCTPPAREVQPPLQNIPVVGFSAFRCQLGRQHARRHR